MLTDSLSLGTGGTLLVFSKQFADAGQSRYSVAGLTASTARTLEVKHESAKSGTVSSVFKLNEVDPIAGSTTGATAVTQVYLVVKRPAGKTAADVKAALTRLKTFVDSTSLQDQFLNQEA